MTMRREGGGRRRGDEELQCRGFVRVMWWLSFFSKKVIALVFS
jgi:hypothetical protein